MSQSEFLPEMAAPPARSPRPKGIVRRIWGQLAEVSEVAVRHHYDALWERVDLPPHLLDNQSK